MAESADRHRVFFALWPDAATAAAIDDVADALVRGGRRVSPAQLHMTLAFVGTVDAPEVVRLLEDANNIAVPAFDLILDQAGYFRRPQIPWLGASQPPDRLLQLADATARSAGLNLRQQRFRPHVSLARRAPPPPTRCQLEPVTWQVRSFCLVESGKAGAPGEYRCLQSWRLR